MKRITSIYKCTQDARRIRSPKPDLVMVRDGFSCINKIIITFCRNLRVNANEIDSGIVFSLWQQTSLSPFSSVSFGLSSFLISTFNQSISLPLFFLNTGSYSPSSPPLLYCISFSSCAIIYLHLFLPRPSFLVLSLLSVAITLLI